MKRAPKDEFRAARDSSFGARFIALARRRFFCAL